MTGAVDPDPTHPGDQQPAAGFGGREEPATGDPTAGGKLGDVGATDSIASDEPGDGSRYPVGGGRPAAGSPTPPSTDPGPGGTL